MFLLFDFLFICFLSSKNHYRLVLAFLSDRYLVIIYINSKDAIKCMLNVNQDTKLLSRQGRLILWLAKSIIFIENSSPDIYRR